MDFGSEDIGSNPIRCSTHHITPLTIYFISYFLATLKYEISSVLDNEKENTRSDQW